MARHLATLRES
jgi:hypothetical protein